MANYQIWVLDEDYARAAFIRRYKALEFTQVLNGMGWATLEMHPNDEKIAELQLMRRLLIYRDGAIVYGGLLLREGWTIPQGAPRGMTYSVHSLDYAYWAYKRQVEPPAGQAYDERTDHADDLAKDYVYDHCGAGAGTGRPWPGLLVAADAHGATSTTESGRYGRVLDLLNRLRDKGPFDWRFVPTASGATFTTGAPHWGVDRRRGNGAEDECIFSLDRRNFAEISYARDAIEHDNYVYVAGQGEGADRTVVERADTTAIAAWGRREASHDARRLELTASLEAEGDGYLAEHAPEETMTIRPAQGTWQGTSGTHWDLGDLVTVDVRAFGGRFTQDFKVTAINVKVAPKMGEAVTPTVEAI